MSLENIRENGHSVKKRQWKKFDLARYRMELQTTDWTDLYNTSNIDIANSILTDRIKALLDSISPMKLVQQRQRYCSWITDETKEKMKERNMKRELARRSGLQSDWDEYKSIRNICTKLQNKEKAKYERDTFEEIIENKDTKKLYIKTRKLLNWRQGGPPKRFLIDGKSIQKAVDIANTQMDYYVKKLILISSSLGNSDRDPLRLLKKAFERWEPRQDIPDFKFKPITLLETVKIIKQLKNSTACGIDNIDTYCCESSGRGPIQTYSICC